MQLLWCPRDHADHDDAPWVRVWWRGDDAGPWAATPVPGADVNPDYLPQPCVLDPEGVIERPSAFELPSKRVEALDEALRLEGSDELARLGIPEEHPLYQYHFSVAPGTKARGFVHWVQDPDVPTCDCGAVMQHLLTIASAEFDGAYQRWMPLEERHVWEGNYKDRRVVQRAAGLMLGDMGSLYVFVCVACPHRPIATRFQCS
jgi:hypothetical protein